MRSKRRRKKKVIFGRGYNRAIKEFLVNPILVFLYFTMFDVLENAFSDLISTFGYSILSPKLFKAFFIGIALVENLISIKKMKFWSTEYLLGYLTGILILTIFVLPTFMKSGFIDIWDVTFAIVYLSLGFYITARRVGKLFCKITFYP